MRAQDAVTSRRRELPKVRIDEEYVFDGPDGKAGLVDLFEGRRQLLIYHFMWNNPAAGPVDTEMTRDLPPEFEKTPPEHVAKEVLDGIEAGDEDTFPNPFAAAFGAQFHSSPKSAER